MSLYSLDNKHIVNLLLEDPEFVQIVEFDLGPLIAPVAVNWEKEPLSFMGS